MAVRGGCSRAMPETMIEAGLAGSRIGKRVQGWDSENIKSWRAGTQWVVQGQARTVRVVQGRRVRSGWARALLRYIEALAQPSCSWQCNRGSQRWLAYATVALQGQDGQDKEQFKTFMPVPAPLQRLFHTRVFIFESENLTVTYTYSMLSKLWICVLVHLYHDMNLWGGSSPITPCTPVCIMMLILFCVCLDLYHEWFLIRWPGNTPFDWAWQLCEK